MQVSRFFSGTHTVIFALVACFASFSAQGATPLPTMADPNLQTCLTEQANRNGWQSAEQVTQLDCSGRGVARLEGIEGLFVLAALDLSNNAIVDAWPLSALRTLTKLNLSGNRSIDIVQLRPVLDINWGLTSLGLNGIRVGAFSNLGALFNPQTGRPYDFVELDLGNTGLTDLAGNKSLDFLQPYASLTRLNVAGNGIDNIQALMSPSLAALAELDLSNNALVDLGPLMALHTLTKLNLSGNRSIGIVQVRPVLDINWGLTSLGLNGIRIGAFSNLGALFNPQTGRPYDFVELDLGNTGLTDFSGNKSLDFLQPYANLTRLNVAGNEISNIQVLPIFTRLAELDLSNNAIADAWPLSALRTLTKLNLSGNRSIDIVQVRPVLDMNWGLTSLGLNGIRVGAFSNLGALFNPQTGRPYDFVELDLGNTGLTDFSGNKSLDFLQPYGNLMRLNIAGNGIDNIQVFTSPNPNGSGPNFAKLSELDISNNAVVDAWPLSALRTLTKLNLSGNRSIDIVQVRPVLDINWGLTSLGLNGIRIGAFSNLGALFNPQTGRPYDFVELDLGNTGLTDFSGNKSLDFLQPYANLTSLNVAGNGIDNIQVFTSPNPNGSGPNFAKLSELDISNNAIIDAWPLSALRTLTKLNLSGNRSIDIVQVRPVLDINWGLTSLGLNGIRIGAFSNLGALFNPQTGRPYDFVELDLGNTGLTDFSGNKSLDFLQSYASLMRLNVAGNGIDNIQALMSPSLAALAELDLSNNALVDLGPLMALHTLTKLNLSGNRSIDIMQVRPVLDTNWGLTSLGLNGIRIGAFSNLGALFNPQTGRPYDFVELDLGNSGLTDLAGNKSLDFLQPYANLTRLNVAGNGIDNIQVFWSQNLNGSGPNFAKLAELDLSSNAIVDVGPLTALRTLVALNLVDNTQIRCVDLDNLALALPQTDIRRPASCVGANVPPVANTGAPQTVNEGSAVTLAGSGIDSDGTIASYLWTQTAGPAVALVNANGATSTFTAPQVTADTVLAFQLTVTDNNGATATATTTVTVANVKGVDLVVTAASGSVTTVKRGSSFYFASTTRNAGDLSTSTSTTTGLYLSSDAAITAGDVRVGAVGIRGLGPGQAVNAVNRVTVPLTLAPGTYYLGAIADYTRRQPELDEANNSLAGIAIQVTQ